jgi:hypothetical protein
MKSKVIFIFSVLFFSVTVSCGQVSPFNNYLTTYTTNPYSYLLFDLLLLEDAILEDNIKSKSTIERLDSVYLAEGKPLFRVSDDFVVNRNRNGTYKMYKLLAVAPEFLILCSRLHKDECSCKEDLYVYSEHNDKPKLVRKIFTFSLKVNLIDQINNYSNDSISYDAFDTTCDIINYIKNR